MYELSVGPAAEFRVANQDDIITAARMVFESYAPYIPILGKIPPTLFEDFGYHISQHNLWMMECDRVAMGMVVLTPSTDHMLLQSMCIMPAYQGLGFGRQILAFSEQHAQLVNLGQGDVRGFHLDFLSTCMLQ